MDARTNALAGPRGTKERGSPEWCWQTVDYLKRHLDHVGEQWHQADEVLSELIEARAYLVIPPDVPYGTLDDLLRRELGMPEEEVRALIASRGLNSHGGDRRSKEFQANNIRLKTGGAGVSKAYTIRRLRRDGRDGLAGQVERGEKTAAAAAREAGWPRPKTMTIPKDDAEAAFRRLTGEKGMSPEQLVRLAELLLKHLTGVSPDTSDTSDRETQ